MRLSGFSPLDIKLVSELYNDSTFAVDNDFGTTAALPVKCGVKQGDIISPTVFSITMNVLLRKLAAEGNGYTHSSGTEYNVLAFADDLCLLTDCPAKMQKLVEIVEGFAKWSGHMPHQFQNCAKPLMRLLKDSRSCSWPSACKDLFGNPSQDQPQGKLSKGSRCTLRPQMKN